MLGCRVCWVKYEVSIVDIGESTRLRTSIRDKYRASVVDTAAGGASFGQALCLTR